MPPAEFETTIPESESPQTPRLRLRSHLDQKSKSTHVTIILLYNVRNIFLRTKFNEKENTPRHHGRRKANPSILQIK